MLVTLNYIKAYLGKNWHHEWMSGLQDHYCPEEESKLVKSEVCQTLVVDSLHALILVRRRLKGTPWTPCLSDNVCRAQICFVGAIVMFCLLMLSVHAAMNVIPLKVGFTKKEMFPPAVEPGCPIKAIVC
jgi:hypothetical protein